MSISRANLPDTLNVAVSQGRRSRKTTPTDDASSQKSDTQTLAIPDEPPQVPTQSVFPARGIPSNPSPNPHLPTQSPTQFIHQDLPIHPGYTPSSASSSPQDLKRKRPHVDPDQPVTTPPSLGFYSPMYMASQPQPFLPDVFQSPSNLPPQGIPTTGPDGTEPYGEQMENYGFPYYFEN